MPKLRIGQELKNAISDFIYPVGSLYIAFNDTNPSTLFSGTWERLEDGYLYCGSIGYVGYQYNLINGIRTNDTVLTVDNLPSHDHKGLAWWGDTEGQSITLNGGNQRGYNLQYSGGNNGDHNAIQTRKTGGNVGHSHAIPSTCVAVWRRTA